MQDPSLLSSLFSPSAVFYNPVGWRQRLLLPTHRLPRERKRKKEKVIALFTVQVRPDGFSLLFLPKRIRHFARAGKENHQKSTLFYGFQKNITSFSLKTVETSPNAAPCQTLFFRTRAPLLPPPPFANGPLVSLVK